MPQDETSSGLKKMIEMDKPRAYNLDDPAEMRRLYREAWGYLITCHSKHGTDWQGRQFAIDALAKLWRSPT